MGIFFCIQKIGYSIQFQNKYSLYCGIQIFDIFTASEERRDRMVVEFTTICVISAYHH